MPGGDSATITLTFEEMWKDSTRGNDSVSASDGAPPGETPAPSTIIHAAPAANDAIRP
jgi:hypothetical protein